MILRQNQLGSRSVDELRTIVTAGMGGPLGAPAFQRSNLSIAAQFDLQSFATLSPLAPILLTGHIHLVWKVSTSPPSQVFNGQVDLILRSPNVTASGQELLPGWRKTKRNAHNLLEGRDVKHGLVPINAIDPKASETYKLQVYT